MGSKELRRFCAPVALFIVFTTGVPAQGNVDHVQKALEDSTFNWRSSESRGVRIYYQTGSFAERHRSMILRSVVAAVDEVLESLGESGYDGTINVFYLESREEMERINGRPFSGFADWAASGVFLVLNPEWRSFEKHELAHVFTMGVWGAPHASSRWMIEGIAIYGDGWCREYTVDEIAFHYLSRGQLPPLGELFEDFAALGEIRGGVYAASFIGFIRHTYGAEAVRKLWHNGTGSLRELLGASADQLERSWRDYLKQKVRKGIPVDIETIEDLGCG